MPATKLKEFLDAQNVKYVTIKHSVAYTAQEIASSAHIRGKELAKTVMVKINGKMAMVVLTASNEVDFERLKKVVGSENVELATEKEFQNLFPGCEVGAMPPFGNLYGMDVFVEESLSRDEEFAFNAGMHSELLKLSYSDYERLVRPRIGSFMRLKAHV